MGLPDVDDPIVDLFAAEASALLAWTVYLLREPLNEVSPLIVKRVQREIDRRILTPLENRHFGWMGFNGKGRRPNNWNPWIVSNWLTSVLVCEEDQDLRVAQVRKALESVDHFLDPYPADGGCDEGPGYWNRAGGTVFDCLEILNSATDGQIDLWDDPLIVNIGTFIYRTHIHDRYFVNFADAAARVGISPAVVFGYGKRIGDADMMALGAWGAQEQSISQMGLEDSLGRVLRGVPLVEDMLTYDPRQPRPRDAWLPDIQVMVARDEGGSEAGFFVAAKGGNNEESHNHNDVGNFVVYVDGKPLIVDIGVEDYTSQTFGPNRYEIWTMRSSFHSVPTINGVEQAPGAQFAAGNVQYRVDDDGAELEMDLVNAYPGEAKVQSWQRSIRMDRGDGLTVVDRYGLDGVTGDLTMSLMTPSEVLVQDGVVTLSALRLDDERESADGKVLFDAELFEVRVEDYPLAGVSFKRGNPWGERLTRVVFTVKEPKDEGEWTIRIAR